MHKEITVVVDAVLSITAQTLKYLKSLSWNAKTYYNQSMQYWNKSARPWNFAHDQHNPNE